MYCPNCHEKLDEDDLKWACPFCGSEGYEPYFYCEYCNTPYTSDGEIWECEYCGNEGGSDIRDWIYK